VKIDSKTDKALKSIYIDENKHEKKNRRASKRD
jgi:hypothetical protein